MVECGVDALKKNELNIPEPKPLPARLNNTPYVFIGDDAFSLSLCMMKPCPQRNLTTEERVFNCRLSRMRGFQRMDLVGILANKWRVFRRLFSLEPEKVKIITSLLPHYTIGFEVKTILGK